MSGPGDHRYAFIDCARGYAILMVIACHVSYLYPNLPYPVRRLVETGWFGVQLFFLASCVTLLMSWHAEARRTGSVDLRAFFLRRWFRIAPAYYLAGVCYFFVLPPAGGFDAWQAMRAAVFVNALTPAWTPTVAGPWIVVPGGWSISVEFCFYVLFPLLAATITSLRRALWLCAAAFAAGIAANLMAARMLASFGPRAVDNFLFFWFPNQASVFALGAVLFFLLRRQSGSASWAGRHATPSGCFCIAAFCGLAYLPLGHHLGAWPPVPAGQAVCLPLMGFVLALARGSRLFVNPAVAAMGKVSFSAYLIHFALVRLGAAWPVPLRLHASGYAAIGACAAGTVLAVALTFAASWISFTIIEQPMINAGKRLIALLPKPAVLRAS